MLKTFLNTKSWTIFNVIFVHADFIKSILSSAPTVRLGAFKSVPKRDVKKIQNYIAAFQEYNVEKGFLPDIFPL